MSNNCSKNTVITDALLNAQEYSSVIFDLFYKNIEYVDWLHDHHNLPYNKDNVICSYYKNGNINGEIVIDNERQCWYFGRATGWVVLPFNIGKYTFSEFKDTYFNNIDKFDKMFVKYMQKTLLNMYYVEN